MGEGRKEVATANGVMWNGGAGRFIYLWAIWAAKNLGLVFFISNGCTIFFIKNMCAGMLLFSLFCKSHKKCKDFVDKEVFNSRAFGSYFFHLIMYNALYRVEYQ